MRALVDLRIEMLIEGDESRIDDLQDEIAKLEAKVDALTMALDESRPRRGLASEVRDEASWQKSR